MSLENQQINSILVEDFNGDKLNLIKAFPGKPILAIIYNNQCLGCTGRAIPLAYEFQKEYENIQVIGIHSSMNEINVTEADIKSIFTIDTLPFPIYLDKDKSVYNQFNSAGTPQWILITKEGILFRSIFGSQESAQNRLMYALEQLKK